MEEYIFNCYMKYQKENNPDVSKKLKSLPRELRLLILLLIGSVIGGLVTFFLGNESFASAFLLLETVLSFVFYWRFENYRIKVSDKSIEKHKEYCSNIANWLKTIDIKTDEHIQLVYTRVTERISKINNEREKSVNRLEKWVQVLAVPILICIISEIIKSDIDINVAIANSFVVIIISALIFSFIYISHILKWLPIKRNIVQMQYFADDLRSILDYRFISRKIDMLENEIENSTSDIDENICCSK